MKRSKTSLKATRDSWSAANKLSLVREMIANRSLDQANADEQELIRGGARAGECYKCQSETWAAL